MQTFLPYKSFYESAKVLRDEHLGNQCYRECKTLLSGGWKNHPAAKMWKGYERALCQYAAVCAIEMMHRDYWKPGVANKWWKYFTDKMHDYPETGDPPWLGDPKVHLSHRRNMQRKGYEFGVEPADGYYWPVDGGYYIVKGKRYDHYPE